MFPQSRAYKKRNRRNTRQLVFGGFMLLLCVVFLLGSSNLPDPAASDIPQDIAFKKPLSSSATQMGNLRHKLKLGDPTVPPADSKIKTTTTPTPTPGSDNPLIQPLNDHNHTFRAHLELSNPKRGRQSLTSSSSPTAPVAGSANSNNEVIEDALAGLHYEEVQLETEERKSAPSSTDDHDFEEVEEIDRVPKNKQTVHVYQANADTTIRNSIFIGLASFRDELCHLTILSAYEKAANPDLLYIGVFQQHANETDCMDFTSVCNIGEENEGIQLHPVCERLGQIYIKRIHSDEARGPTWARHHVEQFLEDQEFYLQVDAHSIFVQNWDELAIGMFESVGNEYAIITTYPDEMMKKPDNDVQDSLMCFICMTGFEQANFGMVKHFPAQCVALPPKKRLKPILNVFWGAGLSFSKAHRVFLVPYDEYTPMLFDGEEFSMACRLWTSGYDFYAPNFDIVYHKYWDENRPRFLDEDIDYRFNMMQKSSERVKYQLGLEYDEELAILTDVEKYPLGDKRTLQSYLDFCGINLESRTATDMCDDVYLQRLKLVEWRGNKI